MRNRQQHQEEIEQANLPVFRPPVETLAEQEEEGAEADVTAQKIEALRKAVHIRNRNLSWLKAPVAGSVLTLTTLIAMSVSGGYHPVLFPTLVGLLIVNYVCGAALLPGLLESHNRAVQALANTEDLRAVGVLAEALSGSDTSNSIAGSVLIRLLPRIRPEDSSLFTPTQRRCLRDALHHAANPLNFSRYNPMLAAAILNALEQIGEAEDIPVLERLARRKPKTAEHANLQDTAAECLSYLKVRLAGPRSRKHLNQDRPLPDTASAQLTPEAVEELSSRLRQIARLRQRNIKITLAGALTGIGLGAVSLVNSASGHSTSPLLLTGLLGSAGLISLFAVRGFYAQRNRTQALIHLKDLRLIGPLVEAAATSEVSGAIAAMTLTSLLPRLQASDASLLNAAGREHLNRAILLHRANTDFVRAALKALEQIGDSTAIPVVQKLAEGKGRSETERSVRRAAQECLPFLQQRAAQKQASQVLLRASDANAIPPNILLRPVLDTPSAETGELLRPGIPPPRSEEAETSAEERTDRQNYSCHTTSALSLLRA